MKTTLVKTLIAAGLVSAPALLLAQTTSVPVPQAGTTAPAAQVEQPNTPSTTTDAANRDSANPANTTDAAQNARPNASTAATGISADISDSAREQFSKLDANSDGSLTQEEFASHSQPQTTPARDASSSTTAGRNGTGPGTPGSTTGSTGGITGTSNDAEREDVQPLSNEELFRKLDANGDGKLSTEEYARTSPANPEVTRDASSSTSVGRNGTGPGTAGSTSGSTGGSTGNADDNKRPE
ncbi:EF-hand domain-containing protein [Prosthecobacter sp. SYSU 5D2]|uniref:EF-hand domain-containing protein n=1 Tax=Prosthecobacter sp. SYSU 5D2 TaxID=3134134 RepID=UPI0031FEC9A0